MLPTNDQEALRKAKLQDVPLDSVVEAVPNLLARNSKTCDAEYGAREDDGALVFHFFPPGYADGTNTQWTDWNRFRDRLEQSLLTFFQPESIDAGYVSELASFYAIIRPPPVVPDQTALLERFFAALEA